jgi:ribonuclease HIII
MSPVLNHDNKILSVAIILKALVHNEAIKTLVHHQALKTLSFLQIFSNVNAIKHELSQSSEFLHRFASKTKLVNELPSFNKPSCTFTKIITSRCFFLLKRCAFFTDSSLSERRIA